MSESMPQESSAAAEQFAIASGTLPGANEDYTAKDLEHLSDQEHVRL